MGRGRPCDRPEFSQASCLIEPFGLFANANPAWKLFAAALTCVVLTRAFGRSPLSRGLLSNRIERVTKPVAKEIEPEHEERNRDPRKDSQMRGIQ